jgi:fatty-acyl-CoA synthase/long-chain acyl-CoA synthetase
MSIESAGAPGETQGSETLEAALAEVRAVQERSWPEEVPREVDYPLAGGGVVDYLRHWARERPEAAAIVFYGREVSYAAYDELSDRFAGWLREQGAAAGDRVGVYLGNCPQFLVAMLGIVKIGAVHVPINPLFREHELAHELRDAGVTILLTQDSLAGLVEAVRADTDLRCVAVTALSDMLDGRPDVDVPFPIVEPGAGDWQGIVSSPRAEPVATDPDALAALNYTGGTTGLPKGCEHTQRHMLYTAATATVASGHQVGRKRSVTLYFLPVFWIAGEDFGILNPLVNGGTVVLMTRWDPDVALTLIERHGAEEMIGTVDNYVELMDRPGFDGARLASLENVLAVSFVLKLTPEIRERWREATGCTLREGSYGMTETHTADSITLGFQDGDGDLHSAPVFCGLPVPGTDFLIVDESGAPVPSGGSGEILVRSPSVLTGYYRNPAATAEALRGDWLATGDVGMLDEFGALHYLARTKEMIKTSGMSVFPAEVEALLRLHPDVQAAAVVPKPDPGRGQVAFAVVELAAGATADADALTGWARRNMAGYKVPIVEIVEALPMTATGKVRKGDLLTRAENHGGAGTAP